MSLADAPRFFVFAGTTHAPEVRDRTAFVQPGPCDECAKAADGSRIALGDGDPSMATLAFGVAGSEGRLRGGGEVFTVLGLGDQASGYAAGITYVGLQSGRVSGLFGLGVGTLWGGDRLWRLSSVASNARGEIGVHLTGQWSVLLRGDVIANSAVIHPVVTLGLQWYPPGMQRRPW